MKYEEFTKFVLDVLFGENLGDDEYRVQVILRKANKLGFISYDKKDACFTRIVSESEDK